MSFGSQLPDLSKCERFESLVDFDRVAETLWEGDPIAKRGGMMQPCSRFAKQDHPILAAVIQQDGLLARGLLGSQ